jgi:hypothetical protein
LTLIGGCKVRDERQEQGDFEPPIPIAPGTEGERAYVPHEPAGSDLADGYDRDRAERHAERRAVERDDDFDRDRVRGEDRVASRQDLQRALEAADRRIARLRADTDLTDQEEDDLDGIERRVREIRQDLGDVKQDADWEQQSDQLRARLHRVMRQLDKAEEREDEA